jgi:putative ABC transport system ATP-binding protein
MSGNPDSQAAPTPLLSAEGVSREYVRGRCVALCDVTLSIAPGEYLAIVGPSGSGKSTLLHLLCGIDRPTSGRVLYEGRQPRTPGEWARLRARKIGFVFQAFNLLPTLTARQNVEVAMFGITAGAAERRRRADELLSRVGLQARAGHRPSELSGGEKQRLAIARSLANSPRALVADEPTGNLDSRAAGEILELLEEIHRREGAALVIVTHDAAIARRAGRIVALRDGRIVDGA